MNTPAEVTITGTALTYTPDGGNPTTFGLTQGTVVTVIDGKRGNSFDYTNQDRWGNAAPPATGLLDALPRIPRWLVVVKREDCEKLVIPMGNITNQPGWTNDQAGAIDAHDDIIAALPA